MPAARRAFSNRTSLLAIVVLIRVWLALVGTGLVSRVGLLPGILAGSLILALLLFALRLFALLLLARLVWIVLLPVHFGCLHASGDGRCGVAAEVTTHSEGELPPEPAIVRRCRPSAAF